MLVNAHTHSEWNSAPCLAREDGMLAWLSRVLAFRESRDADAGIRATAAETGASGIAWTGDFAEQKSAVTEGIVPGRCYKELIRYAVPDIERCGSLAPHSPHTLLSDQWKLIEGFSGHIAVHAGESPEEMELYSSGKGPLADLLRRRGFPAAHIEFLKGNSPMRILDHFGLLGPRTLVVHAVHLSGDDIELIAKKRAHICLCPLSNRQIGVAFGSGPTGSFSVQETRCAIQRMIDQKISIAIGTDSSVSAPSLSLAENARLLLSIGIAADEIRAMLLNASAIGCGGEKAGCGGGKTTDVMWISDSFEPEPS